MNSPGAPLANLFMSLALSSRRQNQHHIPQPQPQQRHLHHASQEMQKCADNSDKAREAEEWPFGIYDYARDHQEDEPEDPIALKARIEANEQKRQQIKAWAKDVAKYPAGRAPPRDEMRPSEEEIDPMIQLARACRAQYHHPYN